MDEPAVASALTLPDGPPAENPDTTPIARYVKRLGLEGVLRWPRSSFERALEDSEPVHTGRGKNRCQVAVKKRSIALLNSAGRSK